MLARLNLAAAIYGTIAVGAVLAVESAQRETYAETVGAAVLALVLYWLAHSYAEYTSHRIAEGQEHELASLRSIMAGEIAILAGAALQLLAVVGCWVAGARLASAVDAGVWTSVAAIVVFEAVAARRAELRGRRLAAEVLLGALLGLGTLGLKLILH